MSILAQELHSLVSSRHLLWMLTRREVAARYAGTAAGVAWAYAQPLLMAAAYYLVFDIVFAMRLGEHAPTKAVGTYLIVGMLPWMAFAEALSRGMSSLLEAGSILQKNALPPILFVARSVLATMVVYGPLLLVLALVYAPLHRFAPAVLAMLPLVTLQLALCLAWGYALAVMAAALRDTVQLVGFGLSVGIFLSPVLFPLTMFPQLWRWALWLNPMTPWVVAYQGVLLQGVWPAWTTWLAMLAWLLAGLALLALLLRRSRDQLVDWL
ncbi:ABC transporter permease [Comamonas flocculans]|uniref:Transport permease protein n=1 Tax=Comamonas flocculans TaxID=2597701 RepID=A0A5B8RZB7_9BURK|nr:ABC transporter permease [Comamonas flocculans]QEA13247.1 ABC transporter [Comamonas flocculans]